jgi:hypothetical protein
MDVPPGTGTVVLVVLGVAVLYLGECLVWPYARCPRCDGGRMYSPDRKSWRPCRRCRGSGQRLRVGRRLLNYWWTRYREGR